MFYLYYTYHADVKCIPVRLKVVRHRRSEKDNLLPKHCSNKITKQCADAMCAPNMPNSFDS